VTRPEDRVFAPPEVVAAFKRDMGHVSYSRAGWDYYDMPAKQKADERQLLVDAFARLRSTLAEHPEWAPHLREVFDNTPSLIVARELF
jgi:hypothetical protein